MDVLPAIDLRDGKVVQLAQGDFDRQTTYSDDPVSVARDFVQAGATWIHMVDLDAAKTGELTNSEKVGAIAKALDVHIELGGGIRDTQAVEPLLAGGASRVVIGSAAISDWAWFEQLAGRDDLAGKLALGLDARAGKLAVSGWTEQLELSAVEVAGRVKGWPLGAIVYTDIASDGMLGGVNIGEIGRIIAATDVPVIASGGVASLQDVRRCKAIGCAGVIIGTAYYEGKINLAEAFDQAKA